MGRKELEALIAILQTQLERGPGSPIMGAWKIAFDKARNAVVFDKCENEGYCEERPAVIALDGAVLDPGGPLFA